MEVGANLKELNMTEDEIDRLTKAFKDDKFREMLRDYAQELSDPENKRRYEEEIKLLEQERGNTIEFIHPEPFRALRTSVDGKKKCFINICTNGKVGKPTCTWGVSEQGRRGQRWSLPHSLHPGKQDKDPKGNTIMIFDVVFHPDTLHIASKNRGFMDMVDSTAIHGIQDAFNVTLDKNNVKEMSTKYKGTPQPCVIRKPIPGYKSKEPSEKPDPLGFPYPDDKQSSTSSQTKPTESPAESKSSQIRHRKTEEATKPSHTVKYRSFIDLQDFRCSRDSAQSPRPKEIVVTIDLPLLKSVTDASLEVRERRLLLESKKPAYSLELPLAYPVDEDKGEAKFNKQRGQLTVTLPVLPSNEAFGFAAQTSVRDDERQEEKSELGEEEKRDTEEEDLKKQTKVGKREEEEESDQEKMRKGENSEEEEEEIGVEEEAKGKTQIRNGQESVEEKLKEQKQENEKDIGKLNLEKGRQDEDKCKSKDSKFECDRAAEEKDSGATSMAVSAEEGNSCVASPETEKQPPSCRVKEGEVNLNSCLESAPRMKTSDIKEETEKTKETLDGNLKVGTDAAFPHHRSTEAASSTPANTRDQNNVTDSSISQGTEEVSKMPATDEEKKSSRGASGNGVTLCSEELGTVSLKQEERENIDGDDLPTEQIFINPEQVSDMPPPVLLREIDEDGNEKVISDHSTSAGFIFQNSLMYELD